MNTHEKYMQRCLELARLGSGAVAPNPMVGSVLVYDDNIIGEGFHRTYGAAHAEVNCVQSVPAEHRHLIEHSTLYVSLEPCSHQGQTPPCTSFILSHHIKKVVTGCRDISAKVDGRGMASLRQHGVEVTEGVLEAACFEMNRRFFHFEKNKQPYIILKWAESADGFMGRKNERTKISNAFTDRLVHQWRSEEAGIMVGYHTAITDDPRLNTRLAAGSDPLRIVTDKYLSLPAHLHLFDRSVETVVFNQIENKTLGNNEYIKINETHFIQDMMNSLYEKKILSVLIEGGSKTLQQFIDAGCWNEARIIKSKAALADGIAAPVLKNALPGEALCINDDRISFYKNSLTAL